jgi:hypothetical protein
MIMMDRTTYSHVRGREKMQRECVPVGGVSSQLERLKKVYGVLEQRQRNWGNEERDA